MKKAKEVNEKYMKEIYLNILKAIVIVLYFFILNLAYENVRREYLDIAIKGFTMTFLFISIYIFEKAYKKDDGKIAMQGIEVLLLATYTLTTEHIINKFEFNFKSYSLVASYLLATYFILKCIIIYTKGRKEIESERSDVREIVKKNEPLKKENVKKNKNEEQETSNIKKQNKTTSQTKKKSTNQVKEENKTITKTELKHKTENKMENPKTTIQNKEDVISQEEKPKRKRVKKEVNEND
ncbi:MAG: hypothetical protein HFJ60_02165 [Clostridia bacterium]|jgi:hypothetical protein|nr:hypothetical protein [Clostridia bacterium]